MVVFLDVFSASDCGDQPRYLLLCEKPPRWSGSNSKGVWTQEGLGRSCRQRWPDRSRRGWTSGSWPGPLISSGWLGLSVCSAVWAWPQPQDGQPLPWQLVASGAMVPASREKE